MIGLHLQAQILRLYSAEKWPIGTVARHLQVHHSVVRRVLHRMGLAKATHRSRPSKVDPYLPFIQETLEKYPLLPSSRIYQMMRERGYEGSKHYIRHVVGCLRPRPPAEAFLRLRTLPGEQAQVDWAHFGKIAIGRAMRPLMAFVMVLSWSRQIFLRFFLGQSMSHFLRGHVEAFRFFQGVARVCLYDNLKSAVLEREGDAIRFNPQIVALAAHYRYEPRPVAVRAGNQKGRVERAIRYLRSAFFAARKWHELDDLNRQALEWCIGEAGERKNPDDPTLSVREAFRLEKAHLLPLPPDDYPAEDRVEVSVGKQPYIRYDLNDYTVPHTLVRRTLVVLAAERVLRVLDGNDVVAIHERSFDKGATVESREHIAALEREKKEARQHRGMDRLAKAAPSSQAFLVAAGERGHNLGATTSGLIRMLDFYGPSDLEEALAQAVSAGSTHLPALRQILDRIRRDRGALPPMPVELPDDPRIKNLVVQPHPLEDYDAVPSKPEEEKEDDDDPSNQ
jgi:transposase